MPRKRATLVDSGQPVYAQYGRLMARVQAIEAMIGVLVSYLSTLSPRVGPRLEDLLDETSTKTLGQICRAFVRALGDLEPDKGALSSLASLLAELLRARNWLAHRYFRDRQQLVQDAQQHPLLVHEFTLLGTLVSAVAMVLDPLANALQARLLRDMPDKKPDIHVLLRQEKFIEYGNVRASIRRLRGPAAEARALEKALRRATRQGGQTRERRWGLPVDLVN